MSIVLMLGSAPLVTEAAHWSRAPFDRIVAINNAWRVRADWDDHIYPWDFPTDGLGAMQPGQRRITQDDFVPAQNRFGGFVYAGGTMAYTAAYWALDALKPRVLAVFGCDMTYPTRGQTHFYGKGTPDPLRADISLRSLEAKSARLILLAAREGCAVVNLSTGPSRLMFPRARRAELACWPVPVIDHGRIDEALAQEAELGYVVPSGRYWEEPARFDPAEIDRLDAMWLAGAAAAMAA